MGFYLLRLRLSSFHPPGRRLVVMGNVPKWILAIAKPVILPDSPRIRRISQRMLAHLNSPKLLFTSQVLIHVLFRDQFKGHEIPLINAFVLN
jgi:hypothetical protein